MKRSASWPIDSPARRISSRTFVPCAVPYGTAATTLRAGGFIPARFKQENRMKFVTLAAIAALTATPVLADPVAREQAKADLHQAKADATRAQMQKEDAHA